MGLLERARSGGRAFKCPCCEKALRAFREDEERPYSVECPNCGSRPRHRLLWLYLAAETAIEREPCSVLHFAPERSIEQRLRALPGVTYLSADLESARADVKADITALDFDDDSFDLVLCSHVLEHVPDDAAAMREMLRVLRPDGLLILQTPVNYAQDGTFEEASFQTPEERLRYFSQADHVRVYGPDLADRLRRVGFRVDVVEYAERFSTGDIERFGLVPRVEPLRNDLYVCTAATVPPPRSD